MTKQEELLLKLDKIVEEYEKIKDVYSAGILNAVSIVINVNKQEEFTRFMEPFLKELLEIIEKKN